MDVGSWLRSLGLGQYEAAFRDNAVDAEVLPELADGDLEKLGVLLGHRKRLLKAIAELAPADKIVPPTSLAPSTTAERRPITVMFCDLVGSTSLAAKLDAEDWRNLVNAYLDQASAAVAGLGGHVLKKLGDGLMAAVRLSSRAGERRRTRTARRPCHPARAGRTQCRKRRQRRAGGFPSASALIPGRWWSTQPARCSARRRTSPRGCKPRPNRGRYSSPRACSGRRLGFSSSRTRARMTSRA